MFLKSIANRSPALESVKKVSAKFCKHGKMTNRLRIRLFICWVFFVTRAFCSQVANKSIKGFFTAADAELAKGAVNCTRFIPANWRQLLQEHNPDGPTSGQLLRVPEDYLLACLRAELKQKNGTSPFSFTPRNHISYNIALKEVVSLDFDGILVTQVRHILVRIIFQINN